MPLQFIAGCRYPDTVLGKPSAITFEFAKEKIRKLLGEPEEMNM
jgi:ribonucleotide monophosphatase NagD (HAD superfamily)